MNKFKLLLPLILLLTNTIIAQKKPTSIFSEIDKKALQLPDSLSNTTEQIAGYITASFSSENDKARAIFIWLASNIEYDVENMYAINFYEQKADKIAKPLKTRKGICENYAALFADICNKVGLNSFLIEGYTKQNGKADYLPHAWCAASVDGSWFMFDPTWGAGYVNGSKFIQKTNNSYFKVNPSTFIKSHIPFDYLWQFLIYPITNQEFYDGKTAQNEFKAIFNFKDSIAAYELQSHIDQLVATAYRIERNGLKNALIFDRLQHIKIEIENERQTKTANLYNAAIYSYNDGVNLFNEFINYRNNQFTPLKSDSEIQTMIDEFNDKLEDAKLKLEEIESPDSNTAAMIKQQNTTITELASRITEQQLWLKEYLSKGKSGRKSMFFSRKISWFGVPLN